MLHNATVIAHGYMNCGTTQDTFLRDNLEWLGKASNWAKFTAVASIGVVHKGHVHESMNLLQPYLPQGGQSSSPFSESGMSMYLPPSPPFPLTIFPPPITPGMYTNASSNSSPPSHFL